MLDSFAKLIIKMLDVLMIQALSYFSRQEMKYHLIRVIANLLLTSVIGRKQYRVFAL